jgi:hypothetical protein
MLQCLVTDHQKVFDVSNTFTALSYEQQNRQCEVWTARNSWNLTLPPILGPSNNVADRRRYVITLAFKKFLRQWMLGQICPHHTRMLRNTGRTSWRRRISQTSDKFQLLLFLTASTAWQSSQKNLTKHYSDYFKTLSCFWYCLTLTCPTTGSV